MKWTGALALLVAGAASAATFEQRLDNGLKVIVKPDHRAPVVVSQVWYRVGSIDEANGTTGVAHALEHLMFKGTKAVPAGQFSKLIAAAGGRENAFTSRDHTVYFQTLEKSRLPLAFRLEADRMANLMFSPEEFAKEIQVVIEERRMRTEDSPQARVQEALMSVAYQAHPYRRPIIGWMNDLENMTVDDARAWYSNWYSPSNATLVVVGDVEPEAVFALARETFGANPARSVPGRKPQEEPLQSGEKRIGVKAPAKLPYLLVSYHVPALRDPEHDWEPYALEMLAGVLDGGDTGRFTRELVRGSRIAVDAGAGYDAVSRGPGNFMLDGTPGEGKTAGDLEAALVDQIERVKGEGVSSEELDRVKAQVIAAQVYQRDSMFYQGMLIGEFETAGLPHAAIETRVAKLKAVTPEQVRDVARKYLVADNRSIAVLDPQPIETAKPKTPAAGGRHAH